MVGRAKPRLVEEVTKPAVKTKSRVKTYTVACKLPWGLRAHIFELQDTIEASPMGPRTIKLGRRVGPEVIINGTAQEYGPNARRKDLVAGWATTTGVDAEFWDTFTSQHKDADYLINKLVIWWPETDNGESISDYAKDGASLLSGFEPLDLPLYDGNAQIRDPRVKRAVGRNGNIQVGGQQGGGDVGNV